MTKEQAKLLKKIWNAEYFDYSNLDSDQKGVLFYLRREEYISPKANPAGIGHPPCYKITESGKTALYDDKKEKIKIFLPIATSIAALVISVISLIFSVLGIT